MIQRDIIPNENFESQNEYTLHVLKRREVYIDPHVHLEGFFHVYVVYYNFFFSCLKIFAMTHGIK